jgi:hypothetical protein
MPVIFLFMAAGALIAGGLETLDQAKRAKAREAARDKQEAEAEILRRAIDVADLRQQARDRGLDPDTVVAGYLALNQGELSVEQVFRALEIGS